MWSSVNLKTETFGLMLKKIFLEFKKNYLIPYFFFLLRSSESKGSSCNCSLFFVLFLLCSIQRDKFVEIDLKPVCKHCYEKMPEEFKRRLAKREREAKDKDKQKKKKPVCL